MTHPQTRNAIYVVFLAASLSLLFASAYVMTWNGIAAAIPLYIVTAVVITVFAVYRLRQSRRSENHGG